MSCQNHVWGLCPLININMSNCTLFLIFLTSLIAVCVRPIKLWATQFNSCKWFQQGKSLNNDKTLENVMDFGFYFPYKSRGSKKENSFSISMLFESNTKHLKCTSFVIQNSQNEKSPLFNLIFGQVRHCSGSSELSCLNVRGQKGRLSWQLLQPHRFEMRGASF